MVVERKDIVDLRTALLFMLFSSPVSSVLFHLFNVVVVPLQAWKKS